MNKVLCGDSSLLLKEIKDKSIDLIITSPPYANQRKKVYGGIYQEDYVEWFLNISKEMLRVLKPTGTFILNIKEHVHCSEKHTYVLELILALKKQGWLWTEEFIWHKKNCFPGKWPNRFRNAWERLLQFNKNKKFNMYQKEVMVPIKESTKKRLKNLNEKDKTLQFNKTGSGFSKNYANFVGRDKAYPTNVLHMATECSNKVHSAVFPKELPEWFIKLFTKPGDIVLDPFAGSGTALVVAKSLGRNYIGIDIVEEYCELTINNLRKI